VFLPTDFIGSESWFWTDRLAYLISKCGEDILLDVMRRDIRKPLSRQLSRLQGSRCARLDKAIRILKPFPKETIEENALGFIVGMGYRGWSTRQGVSFLGGGRGIIPVWIRWIRFTHGESPNSSDSDDNTVRHELDSSRSELISRRAVDPDFIPFCYPNGNMTSES